MFTKAKFITLMKKMVKIFIVLVIIVSLPIFIKCAYNIMPRMPIESGDFKRGNFYIVIKDTDTNNLILSQYANTVDISCGEIIRVPVTESELIVPVQNTYSEISSREVYYRAEWDSENRLVVWVMNDDLDFDNKYIIEAGKITHAYHKHFDEKAIIIGGIFWIAFFFIMKNGIKESVTFMFMFCRKLHKSMARK
jgi:hypothetical protein